MMDEQATTEAVLVALRRIMRVVDQRSRQLVARHGVTGPQLLVLKELSRKEHLSVRELCRDVHLSQPTVTGIIDRLEARGLVCRRRDQKDRRKASVTLTPEGVNLLAGAPPLMHETFTAAFGQLADWEQTQILTSLQRIAAMMEGAGDTSVPAPPAGIALESLAAETVSDRADAGSRSDQGAGGGVAPPEPTPLEKMEDV